MKSILAVASVAILAGCAPLERPTYREPAPTPVELPPIPPERILRLAPDFRFKDPESGKTYSYRGYNEKLADGTVFSHEIVTVLDPDGAYEREADASERAYAMDVLEKDWRRNGLDERIKYHQDLARMGQLRRDAQLDSRIGFAEMAKKELEEHLLALEADLQSSTRTAGYKAPAGHLEFLQREISVAQLQLAETKADLETLRFLKASRERAFGRTSRVPSGS